MLHGRWASLAIAIVATAALAACSSDDEGSDTIEISTAEAGAAGFLTTDDVALISGFEGAEVRSLEDFPLFANPDLRGPCGAELAALSLVDATGLAIGGSTISLVQITMPTTAEMQAYLSELFVDQGPPCGPYRSTTNTGDAQTVSEITVYELGGGNVEGVAWTSLVQVEGGSVYLGLIVLQDEETTTLVQIQSATAIPDEGIRFLAEAATLRLLEASDGG